MSMLRMKKRKKKQTNKNQQNAFQTKKICFQLKKKISNVASNNCSVNIKMQSQIHTT